MSQERKDDRLQPVLPDDEEPPQVYGVVKRGEGFALDRRTFLGGLAAGALVSASGREASGQQPTMKAESSQPQTGQTGAKPAVEVKGEGCAGAKLKGHKKPVNTLAFSPDGKLLVSGGADGAIKLWALPEGKLLATLTGHSGGSVGVAGVAFSSDGKLLASGGADSTIKLWTLPKDKPLTTLGGHTGWITSVAVSPDGKLLASASRDNTVKLWGLPEGKLLTTLTGHGNSITAWVVSVVISPDGKLLASGSGDKTIKLWALPDGKLLTTLTGHLGRITALAIGPDGKLLASSGADNSINLWTLPQGNLLTTLRSERSLSLAISPDGKLLASGGGDHGIITLWALPEGKLLTVLAGRSGGVNALAFDPAGKLLASGSTDGAIQLWPLPRGESSRCLWDPDATAAGTQAKTYRQMGPNIVTAPCKTPLPPGATCICNCVAGAIHYPGRETVCVCDTITVAASAALPAGVVCICDTISVGTYRFSLPQGHKQQFSGTVCTCNTICTCDTISTSSGGHYWYPS